MTPSPPPTLSSRQLRRKTGMNERISGEISSRKNCKFDRNRSQFFFNDWIFFFHRVFKFVHRHSYGFFLPFFASNGIFRAQKISPLTYSKKFTIFRTDFIRNIRRDFGRYLKYEIRQLVRSLITSPRNLHNSNSLCVYIPVVIFYVRFRN